MSEPKDAGLPGEIKVEEDKTSLKRVQEVGSLLAREASNDQLRAELNILRDTMTPAEAAQALTLGIRSGNDRLAVISDYALGAVATAWGRARRGVTAEEAYVPSDTERQRLAELLAAIQENLEWMVSTDYRRTNLSGGLHSLLNQNPELAGSAVSLVGALLAREASNDQLRAELNILRDTMTPAEAAQALTLGIRSGNDRLAVISDYALGAVATAWGRARRGVTAEEAYVPSDTERQRLAELLAAIQENLEWMVSTDYRRTNLSGGLHSLLNQNPEFKDLAKQLLEAVDRDIPERLVRQVAYVAPLTPASAIENMIDRGTARAIVTGIERFRYIQRVLAKLPEDQRQIIRDRLDQELETSPDTAQRLNILGALFEASQSQYLIRVLARVGATLEQIPQIFSDAVVGEIISIMAENPGEYRFQLGALLTQIPIDNLPETIRKKLKPTTTEVELKLRSEHGTWWLCGAAEPRLRDAIRDKAIMLVNDRLLVKFNGKLSAVCIESFTTPNGAVFLEGNWYSPTDNQTRDQLRSQFDQGHAQVQLVTGEWAIMRPLDNERGNNGEVVKTSEQVLEEIRGVASRIPDRLPDRMAGLERRSYREVRREEG